MRTPLEPTFRKRIRDSVSVLQQRQVTPWLFMTVAPFAVNRFDGRRISYSGIAFAGSPEQVFWNGYIEPFLENLCITEIEAAASIAREKTVDAREVMPEVIALLDEGITRIYLEMASVHERLYEMGERGEGGAVDTAPRIARMKQFARERVDAEIRMFRHPSAYERWFQRNQFCVWAVPTVISLIALGASLIALRPPRDAQPTPAPLVVPEVKARP